jgi:large subunit ribosomal protein L23
MAKTKTKVEATEEKVVAPVKEKKVKAPKAEKPAKKEIKVEAKTAPAAIVRKGNLKAFDVILRPLITEKSMNQLQNVALNKVTVEVNPKSNKTEVKLAFESTYQVKVKSVNILNVRARDVRRGRYQGTLPAYKKAIVTLAEGQALDLFKETK